MVKKVKSKSVEEVVHMLRKFRIKPKSSENARKHAKQDQEDIQELINKMQSDSNSDTDRAREHISSLCELNISKVDPTEAYGYTKFPAPIMDYLDYIKSTKNNLRSWGDLKSFLNTTDMFWKVMRDQSLKIAIDFANKCRHDAGVHSPSNMHNGFYDKPYYREIIKAYIFELERDKAAEISDSSKRMLELILGYSQHECDIKDSLDRN